MASGVAKVRVAELPLIPAVAFALSVTELGLATLGLKRMLALMPAMPYRPPGGCDGAEFATRKAHRLAWLVQGVARRLPGTPRCLAQSLVLRSLLARHGLRSEVIIGVRSGDAAFDAHAWVEYCGVPLQPEVPAHSRIAAL